MKTTPTQPKKHWMTLIDTLTAVGSRPAALLVRHAEREPVKAIEQFLTARLTPAGVEASISFGRALGASRRVTAWHSPVPRCAETAKGIVEGAVEAGAEGRVEGVLTSIGGPYVRDPVRTFGEYVRHRAQFVRHWFDGAYPDEMIASRTEATALQMRGVFEVWEPEAPDSLGVFVTHDWNLLAIREEVLGLRFEEVGWIDYLEGMVLSANGKTLCLRHGDAERCLSRDRFLGT